MRYISVVVLLFLTACATTKRMNRVSVGMTKSDVIDVMGRPRSTSAISGGAEFLRYSLIEDLWSGKENEYFVKISDGKVEAFGRMGDFDSTKDPTVNVNLNKK